MDTNVLISALHFGGGPDKILDLVRRGVIEMFISPFILDELERVLREKFNWSAENARRVITKLRAVSTPVEPKRRVKVIREKDSDNRVLECALEANADYLVTGDTKHLRPLGRHDEIVIVSPREFLEIIGMIP